MHTQNVGEKHLEPNGELKLKYKSSNLHFSPVTNRLHWNQLLIIDWLDIDLRSEGYSFLKELGVREVPDLHKLIYRIDNEHDHGSKTKDDYKLPHAHVFLAENFQQHYSKLWKNANIKIAFLPSSHPDQNRSIKVILTIPNVVFKELGPSLLSAVLRYFSQYFDIGLPGVKQRLALSMAFDLLMEKRNQSLTVESDPTNYNFYVKPSQIFIRSKTSPNNVASSNNLTDDVTMRGLIDYIDYGYEANSFLISVGVLSYPSTENLAGLLIEHQSSYLNQNKGHNDDLRSIKLRISTNCLKQSAVPNIAQQLNVEALRSRLSTKRKHK